MAMSTEELVARRRRATAQRGRVPGPPRGTGRRRRGAWPRRCGPGSARGGRA